MRLIDVDKLLDILDVMIVGHKSASDVYDVVDSMPTVDAVPVVRCKDCRFSHMTYGGECKYCDVWEAEDEMYLDGDFYCAFGERREDDNK